MVGLIIFIGLFIFFSLYIIGCACYMYGLYNISDENIKLLESIV